MIKSTIVVVKIMLVDMQETWGPLTCRYRLTGSAETGVGLTKSWLDYVSPMWFHGDQHYILVINSFDDMEMTYFW